MKLERAPRSKKRVSCGLLIDGHRYKGIVLDVSASGLFIQTNVKPTAGTPISVTLTLPDTSEQVVLDARVARKKAVPAALLTAAGGGVGLSISKPPKAYLEFIAKVSPAQADYVASNAGAGIQAASDPDAGTEAPPSDSPVSGAGTPAKRFRVHAVETSTGRKNSYLVNGESEESASAHVLDELGSDWQVIFIERV